VVIENFVLCELVSKSGDTPYRWKSENSAEVGFVVQSGTDVVPVEVKSAGNARARSLAEYVKNTRPKERFSRR
jgi:predicted AAA+ superfamily ATPase